LSDIVEYRDNSVILASYPKSYGNKIRKEFIDDLYSF